MEINRETAEYKKAQTNNTRPEAEIRQVFDQIMSAMEATDVEKLMTFYAPDVVAYDVAGPLQFIGKDEYKKSWVEAFEMCSGGEAKLNDVHDLKISANEDLAFVHSIRHNVMTPKDGKKIEMWMRATQCFEKLNGKWLITHEQFSFPMDFETGKAHINQRPEEISKLH